MVSADLRRVNLAAILSAVDRDPEASRGSVARTTGLTRTAVNALVAQMVDGGILAEEQPSAPRVGRPSPRLRLAGENFAGISVELQRTAVSTMAADLSGGRLRTWREATHGLAAEAIGSIVMAQVRAAYDEVSDKRVLRVVLAVHGQVDRDTSEVRWNWHAEWRGFDAVAAVRAGVPTDVRVTVENDATVAALAERRHGVGSDEDVRSIVSISSDLGVGVGVLLDGVPFRGSHGYGAELGHMLIDPEGPQCNCGRRGCWSAFLGLRNVFRDAMPDLAASLERLRGYETLAAAALRTGALNGEPQVLKVLERAGYLLGVGAANAANAFDPDRIVVGGYLVDLAPWVLGPARAAFGERALRGQHPERDLQMSTLGADRVLHGGLTIARDALVADPASILDR